MTDKPKRPRDMNQLAKSIVDEATGACDPDKDKTAKSVPARAKGGKARAERLTEEQRADIARTAALSRWKKG